jgi:hypothetical protein
MTPSKKLSTKCASECMSKCASECMNEKARAKARAKGTVAGPVNNKHLGLRVIIGNDSYALAWRLPAQGGQNYLRGDKSGQVADISGSWRSASRSGNFYGCSILLHFCSILCRLSRIFHGWDILGHFWDILGHLRNPHPSGPLQLICSPLAPRAVCRIRSLRERTTLQTSCVGPLEPRAIHRLRKIRSAGRNARNKSGTKIEVC